MIDPLRRGHPAALIEWTRLATGFLVEMRAYDFADEWEDLLHRVLARLVAESPGRRRAERGEARDRMRAITCDELSQDLRSLTQWREARELPWCESALIVSSQTTLARPFDDEAIAAVKHELGNLPEQRNRKVLGQIGPHHHHMGTSQRFTGEIETQWCNGAALGIDWRKKSHVGGLSRGPYVARPDGTIH